MSRSAQSALEAATPLLDETTRSGRIPGAALAVVGRDGEAAFAAFGLAQREPEAEPLTSDAWFDLASLTKPIFTAATLLRLVEEGRVSLDTPLAAVIPDLSAYDLAAPVRRLTLRDCLAHQTFLPAVEPLYTYGQDPATLRAFVLQRRWPEGPPVYSDINYILLGIAVERLLGQELTDAEMAPGLTFRPQPEACAATEFCTWRGRVLRGEVHDENSHALGGAAGHAGLFGTAEGVIGFARSLLRGEGWSEAALAAFRTRVGGNRSCGWEVAHSGWHGGSATSDDAIGHLGFTGTGLWVDFGRGVSWTLLTNRVHPSRYVETGIMPLRRAVGEAVAAAFSG